MTFAGILLGLLNCLLLAVIIVLVGAIVAWIASVLQWPIPENIQRIFLLIVLLIFIICVVSLLVGTPMVHFIGRAHLITPAFGSAAGGPQIGLAAF